jgi:hypothetical protein
MGAVEDVRKALQDVIAPDLKALQVEVREGFASVEKQFAAVKDCPTKAPMPGSCSPAASS